MQAIGEYILIEPAQADNVIGKIVIPDSVKESMKADCEWAKVISVGDEAKNPALKPGCEALILLGSCLTLPQEMKGKNFLLCKYSRVVAVR